MKKKVLLTGILSIVMCLSLIAGATMALFTSESKVNIAVTSGNVEVVATIDDEVKLSSMGVDRTDEGTFANGGSVTVEEASIGFNLMTPGDSAQFTINVENKSNVDIQYRTIVSEVEDNGLLEALEITIDGETFSGYAATKWEDEAFTQKEVVITITLPKEVQEEKYEDNTCKLLFKVEAVQGNAPVVNVDNTGITTTKSETSDGAGNTASADAGVKLNEGETTFTLKVEEKDSSQANIGDFELSADSEVQSFDVKIEEVAEGNKTPIKVTMKVKAGLENVSFLHKGTPMMSFESAEAVDAHHEFYYDKENGEITFATINFSNFTLVSNLDLTGVAFVSTIAELKTATSNADVEMIVLSNDIVDVPVDNQAPYGNKYGIALNGAILDGNGYVLDFKWNNDDHYGIMTSGGTIKNITIGGVFRAVMIMSPTEDLYIDNAVIGDEDVCYAINTGETATGIEELPNLYISNSTIKGWNSYGTAVKSITFKNCIFAQGEYYTNVFGRLVKPYVNTLFENCEFDSKYYIDLSQLGMDGDGNVVDENADAKITLRDCKVDGVELTTDNWNNLIVPEADCGNGQISIELKDGSYLLENIVDYVVIE